MARASICIHNQDGPSTFKCSCGHDTFWRTGDESTLLQSVTGYECQRCHAVWSEQKSTKPRAQPESDAPPEVKAAKLELRRLSAAVRATRKGWIEAREAAKRLMDKAITCTTTVDTVKGIGALTFSLWLDEAALEAAAARWRFILAEREAMPAGARWSLADLEAWASWSPGVL